MAVAVAAASMLSSPATADENGITFWIPGQFGSLAAGPTRPGWSLATIFYHTSVTADGAVAAGREITIAGISTTADLSLDVEIDARADLQFIIPTYTFETPVLGGQLGIGVAGSVGYNSDVDIDGTLTGPLGSRQDRISDSRGGFSDLYPMATLKWRSGVNNYMTYLTGNIPVGAYDRTRLANFGIGPAAIDGGVGYTYLDLTTGREFSIVTGLPHNFENPVAEYKNGITERPRPKPPANSRREERHAQSRARNRLHPAGPRDRRDRAAEAAPAGPATFSPTRWATSSPWRRSARGR